VYGGDTVAPPGNQAANGEHKLHAYSTEDLSLLDKNLCGLARVVFQEPPKPFATLHGACTLGVLADRRKEQHVTLALVIPLMMKMRHVGVTQRFLQKRP
jgi:hypothetical protein